MASSKRTYPVKQIAVEKIAARDDFNSREKIGEETPSELEASKRGDEGALFECHAERLQRAVGRAVGAPAHIIEEACSFAWLKLIQTRPERDAIFAWLRVVATHEAVRLARRAARDLPLDANAGSEVGEGFRGDLRERPGGAGLQWALEVREALEQVASLPRRQVRLFALHLAGLTYEEIAAETGDSRRTVERQLLRARARLRRSRKEGGEVSGHEA